MSSKFKKARQKAFKAFKSPTIKIGFSNIDTWVDMGNFAMNRIMSGKFKEGLLFGRNYVYYGESGSGKSLQAAYACANAQRDHGAFVLWIDVEKATDDQAGRKWLGRVGVDISDDNFEYAAAATLGDVKKIISDMCQIYRDAYTDDNDSFKQPMVIVVDSWSATMTESQWKQALEGEVKGDQGQKAKQTGDVVQATTHLASHLPVLVIGIGHIMDSQEEYGPRHKTTGGHKMFYMASGCMMFTKKELKTDDKNTKIEDDEVRKYYEDMKKGMPATMTKRKQVIGHVCVVDNLKSRASKPFQRIEIQVPFNTGMDPYSGLMDLLIYEGAITVSSASWYQFGPADNPTKFQRSGFRKVADDAMAWADQLNPNGIMEQISAEEAQAEYDAAIAEEEEDGGTEE